MTNVTGVNNCSAEQIQYKKPGILKKAGGCAAGILASNLVKICAPIFISPSIMFKMAKINTTLTKDQFEQIGKATEEAIKTSGLDKKGVSILKATSYNAEEISGVLKKEVKKGFARFLPESYTKDMVANVQNQVLDGMNAFYADASKKIVLPENGMKLVNFHEIGHALNANCSKFGKILQKSRAASMLVLPILLISLLKTKKAEGEQPKNKLDKAGDFIKNNAGKLAFASFLPVIAEESLATIKGLGLAKKTLSPDLVKKIAKTNVLGLLTYVSLALFTSIGITLGVKLKDKIAHNEVKKQ